MNPAVEKLLPGTLQNLFFPPKRGEYTYFEQAVKHPFIEGTVAVKAAWAADASMLAYARYGKDRMTYGKGGEFAGILADAGLRDVQSIGDWKASGTQGYFASNSDFAILAFRGTEADDRTDQQDDLDILLVHEPNYRPVPDHPQPALGHLSLIEQLFSTPCLVHQGFQRALNRVWDDVHQCVTAYRKNSKGEICLTGHSLGAALALLAFSRFDDASMSLFTFGCPRVGNEAFCERVRSGRSKSIQRYVNYNDSVTHVPPESALYRHVPRMCLRFDENGDLGTDDDSFKGDLAALSTAVTKFPKDFSGGLEKIAAPPGVVDHSPARYCMLLWGEV